MSGDAGADAPAHWRSQEASQRTTPTMRLLTPAIVLLVSACASAPKPSPAPQQAPPQTAEQQKSVKCTGGAMALIAITKPWGLKDCVSGSDQ